MTNKKSKKKLLLIIPICVVLIAIWIVFIMFYPFTYINGIVSDEVWMSTHNFSLDYTIQLEKDPSKDFVVLNLADIQLSNLSLMSGAYTRTTNLISQLVEEKDPDLITLTGDNVAGPQNAIFVKNFAKFLDGFDIPWAPVMGNHDDNGSGDFNYIADLFLESENCILKKGPSDMGVGNYVITIMENEEIVEALIMLDTHSYQGSGYDHIWNNQQDFYRWVVNGLTNIAGHIVDTTLMFHIPLVEWNDAWNLWVNSGYDPNIGVGEKNETVCCSETNNGFFSLIKELGSTKNVLCGHDHVNTFSIMYEGVRLSYTIKSSIGSYYNSSIMGGTVLSISSAGVDIEQYIP